MKLPAGADAQAVVDFDGFVKQPVLLKTISKDGKKVVVKITVVTAEANDPYFDFPRWGNASFGPDSMSQDSEGKKDWHLPDHFPPRTLIKSIEIWEDGQPVLVPLVVFCDICNLLSVALYPTETGFEIKMVGGDAATSYIGVLKFKGRAYGNRKMVLGEDPDGSGFD
jgi:hypothetical protein